MRNVRAASQALRLASESPRQQYVCRACLAQASRQIHTSPKSLAEAPWFKRLSDSMFGTKESKRAEKSREENRQKRLEETSQREKGELRTKSGARGIRYEIAEVVDTYTHKDYVSAQTWDGLEMIGGEQWVRKRADMGEQYHGFVTRKKTQLTNAEWQRLLHHIAVEVLALKNAGRDVMQVCNARTEGDAQRTATVKIVVENGAPSLRFDGDVEQQAMLSAIREEVDLESPVSQQSLQEELSSATASAAEHNVGLNWMASFELEDPSVKLAILKRAMQLTGKRVPDPVLSNVDTLAGLYNAFKIKEKPKKLAQDPKLEELKDMSNVKVYSKRRTPVDKDREVGRWKIIEAELKLRNLPVFGTNYKDAKLDLVKGQ